MLKTVYRKVADGLYWLRCTLLICLVMVGAVLKMRLGLRVLTWATLFVALALVGGYLLFAKSLVSADATLRIAALLGTGFVLAVFLVAIWWYIGVVRGR